MGDKDRRFPGDPWQHHPPPLQKGRQQDILMGDKDRRFPGTPGSTSCPLSISRTLIVHCLGNNIYKTTVSVCFESLRTISHPIPENVRRTHHAARQQRRQLPRNAGLMEVAEACRNIAT